MEQGKIMEAEAPTVRVGATPTGLTAPPHNPPRFFTGRMPFLPPNQQRQSTEGKSGKTKTYSQDINLQHVLIASIAANSLHKVLKFLTLFCSLLTIIAMVVLAVSFFYLDHLENSSVM